MLIPSADKIRRLCLCQGGKKLYDTFLATVNEYGFAEDIKKGVLVGFSGGADSVMLLSLLLEYRKLCDFKIVLCHVNHNIRGREADRDEQFSIALADELGLEIIICSRDVPELASRCGKGLEEMARDVRYSEFAEIMQGRSDIGAICLAHNSTDNLETVIFNLTRGASLRGLCGIPPRRDNIIRPLINISSAEIRGTLDNLGISYVTDSTNSSVEYSRNYIRHSVLPLLYSLNPRLDNTVSSTCSSLASDRDFIEKLAKDFIAESKDGKFRLKDVRSLDKAVFSSFFALYCSLYLGFTVYSDNINKAYSLIHTSEDFRLSLPNKTTFICEQGICVFVDNGQLASCEDVIIPLSLGENKLNGFNATIVVEKNSFEKKTSLNVYKFTTEAIIPSGIIEGELYLRFKRQGDAYRFGGMSRKLKKVFNDRSIPPYMRERIPIICDNNGILWCPGLPVREYDRENVNGETTRIGIVITERTEDEREIYIANKFSYF